MMKTTHQIITKYIDEAVNKAVSKSVDKASEEAATKAVGKMKVFMQQLNTENKQHMTDLKTFFSLELGKVAEITQARPTEERVREIVQEEMAPLTLDINIIKKEVSTINAKVSRL